VSRDVVLDKELGDVDGGEEGGLRLSARRRRSLIAIFRLILFGAGYRGLGYGLVEKDWLCA